MTAQFYPNGIGGSVGDTLDVCRPLQISGSVWYVSSTIGTDAGGVAGQNREKPLATTAQAVTNASSDDIIVYLQGHSETLTATQVVAKRLTFIGEGTSSGKPSVTMKMNAANAPIYTVSTTNVEFRNIYFPENVQANGAAKITSSSALTRIRGCYFEQGANDSAQALSLGSGGDQCRVESTTFISTAVLRSAQPLAAIKSGAAVNDLEITDCIFSAGTVGFSNYAAIDLSAGAAARCKFTGLSLLLGADMKMGSSATGYANIQTSTGGSRVDWT